MNVEVDKEDLEEVYDFMNNKLVDTMNSAGLSFGAMAFILQSLLEAYNDAMNQLDKD